MNYKKIKKMVLAGEKPTVAQLDKAIVDQTSVVALYANSVAKHAAKLLAAEAHPWPLPEDQEGRVLRRTLTLSHEHSRLLRLHYWRELAANPFTTAPEGIGSA